MRVSVVYCTRETVWTRDVEIEDGSTLGDAIDRSGVLAEHPALVRADLTIGVFSHPRPLDAAAHEGDRIEIYRPLLVDPKEARRHRAELRRKRKATG